MPELRSIPAYRASRIGRAVAESLARYEWLQVRERLRPGSVSAAEWERAHDRTASTIHDLGVELGGFFVKLCQVAGARADALPEPFIRRLSRFHDRVPPRPFAELRPAIERDLGRPLAAEFTEVDETPLAAASLAQVHRARLRNGDEVVIKVQYPEVARLARADLTSLRRAMRVVALVEPGFDLRSVVDEVSQLVELELDFALEAESTERVRIAFADDPIVRVPRLYPEYSTGRLLVLEYLEGIRVTDLDALRAAGIDLTRVAERVAHTYGSMIFRHGFFQGDPHPGNILVLPGTVIGLLDFGLAKELPPGFAPGVAAMILRGLAGDAEGAAEAARDIGFEFGSGDAAALPWLIGALMGNNTEEPDLRALLGRAPIAKIPSHFGLIVRVLLLLNGLSHTLAPGQWLIQRAMTEALLGLGAEPTTADGGSQIADPPTRSRIS